MCYRGYVLRLSNRNYSLIILFKILKIFFENYVFLPFVDSGHERKGQPAADSFPMWEANSAPLSFPSCLIIPVSGARRAAQPVQSSLFAHCSSSWTTVLEEPEAIGS